MAVAARSYQQAESEQFSRTEAVRPEAAPQQAGLAHGTRLRVIIGVALLCWTPIIGLAALLIAIF